MKTNGLHPESGAVSAAPDVGGSENKITQRAGVSGDSEGK